MQTFKWRHLLPSLGMERLARRKEVSLRKRVKTMVSWQAWNIDIWNYMWLLSKQWQALICEFKQAHPSDEPWSPSSSPGRGSYLALIQESATQPNNASNKSNHINSRCSLQISENTSSTLNKLTAVYLKNANFQCWGPGYAHLEWFHVQMESFVPGISLTTLM